MKNEVTFIIVDDHPISRGGISALIQQDSRFRIVDEFDTAEEALEFLDKNRVDFAIVDITLKGMDGIQLIKEIRSQKLQVNILVLSMHDEYIYAKRVIQAGAQGYIMKKALSEKILEGIYAVLKGEVYLSPAVTLDPHDRQPGFLSGEYSFINDLSDRELEIFQLMGQGLTPKQISSQVGIGVGTVHTYCTRIKEKFSLKTNAELREKAVLWDREKNKI
ncbi:MAG: response regulator transcription factor [Spirochaetales bacterium]|nr:response regulator transcription factor [Spirochaetales bacterium]